MAQFRTSADILTEVLQKSGEPTNGTSRLQTLAMTYINKVHHAIIGGGSILNLNVDEPWVWARNRYPIIIELQTAYSTGAANCTQGSTNISFSSPPSFSLEGWHFQAIGSASTVYKITNHTANQSTAQLDSNFVDVSGSPSFRAMKLDYPIFPAFLYVENHNDMLDFQEINGTVTTTLNVQLNHGSYTPTNFISQVVTQLNAVGTASYSGSFDTVAHTFVLSASACPFNLLGASGINTNRCAMPTLGLDVLDYTGAQSYSSTYQPNQISRMVEPFKMFVSNWWGEHLVYSTDPVKMQEDYPMQLTSQRYPDRFAHMGEDQNGINWVRFNSYPIITTRLQIDWIPQPVDLQNNTASFAKLPRQDTDALIDGAAAYLLWHKRSAQWQDMLSMTEKQLDAMKKKNHDKLLRTGQYFGQIIPRQDLNRSVRRFNYGYTVTGSTASMATASTTPSDTMLQYTLGFGRWNAASTAASATAATLPSNCAILALMVQLTQSFTGASITSVLLNVGTNANPTQFINGFSVNQSTPAQASATTFYFPATATPIMIQLLATGANLSVLTSGMVNLFLQETVVP